MEYIRTYLVYFPVLYFKIRLYDPDIPLPSKRQTVYNLLIFDGFYFIGFNGTRASVDQVAPITK